MYIIEQFLGEFRKILYDKKSLINGALGKSRPSCELIETFKRTCKYFISENGLNV